MKWMNKLERKFGKYAIPNLMFYVIVLYVVGLLVNIVTPGFYEEFLCLDPEMILQGQIWRVVTFLIQPPPANLIFMIFALYLYYSIGRQLEYAWGTFKFNLYFFMGVFFNILATFIAYLGFGITVPLGTYYLNTALFLSYAALYPNQRLYLFFFIPIKIKWLAWLEAIVFGDYIVKAILSPFAMQLWMGVSNAPLPEIIKYILIGYVLPNPGIAMSTYVAIALEIFVALLNFVIFFFATRKVVKRTFAQKRQKKHFDKAIREAKIEIKHENGAKHKCHVCGRTELDDETLEFRYCSKCNGDYEYCQDHLFTHEHIK